MRCQASLVNGLESPFFKACILLQFWRGQRVEVASWKGFRVIIKMHGSGAEVCRGDLGAQGGRETRQWVKRRHESLPLCVNGRQVVRGANPTGAVRFLDEVVREKLA